MNAGLLLWGAALAVLILSIFAVFVGSSLLLLTVSGITKSVVGLFGVAVVIFGVAGVYFLYQWFTEGLEE
jgi:hypothetical protein